jgi:parallel beta-helix repeat protein
VTNCTFSGNTATYGGGGIFNFSSSPTVTNCTFSENSAATGGGMLNGHGNPTVIDCRFSGNSAGGGGGGGMHNERTSPTVIGCTFSGNSAFFGGGMSNRYNGSPTLTDCTFTGNTAGWAGGGMVNLTGSPTVTNCTFIGNSADDGGGMFNADGSSPTVTSCTFSGNSAPSGANLFATDQFGGHSMPTVNNSVIHGSGAGSITDVAGALTVVNYSDVQGGWPGIGNIDADPLFVDPDNDDFRLSSGSPCIDAGNNWGVPIDENDYDEDGVLCELFPVDLDGNPRFNADEVDFDPGCGVPVVVDMGAYEYQFDPVDQVTFADLNGDNVVGATDLLGLLVSWGPCGKGCCLADLNIDGSVGASDLLALLVNWGPCP